MKNIIIIDHFSDTPNEKGNNRFVYLAKLFVEKGHNVELITTIFSHNSKQKRLGNVTTGIKNYIYTMLDEPGYKKNISFKRLISHFIFGVNLRKYLVTKSNKIDLIYIVVPSLSVGYVAARFCKKKRIPLVVDVRDIWPEAFRLVFNIPFLSDLIFFPFTKIANFIYKNADLLVAVSDTYLERAKSINKKNIIGLSVFIGTDLSVFNKNVNLYSIEKPYDEFWVIYIGTVGHSYDIGTILKAINRLNIKGYENIVLKILGDGPLLVHFQQEMKKYSFRCDFLGRKPYEEMVGYLAVADIAVNPISKGAAQSIINKVADYAAAGLPVINTQECIEYRSLIEKFEIGLNSKNGDFVDVADNIEVLYNDNELCKKMRMNHLELAKVFFDRKYTYRKIVTAVEDLIEY